MKTDLTAESPSDTAEPRPFIATQNPITIPLCQWLVMSGTICNV